MPDLTIEQETEGEVWVWEHSIYPLSSVLAGQTRHVRVEKFSSVQEAQDAYPSAKHIEPFSHAFNREASASFARSPAPDWFDPNDAGEQW